MEILKVDVLIAGGGPAGASCAKALKDAGLKVLLIEKGILPRHKTCSGVLFGQTQELLKKYFGELPPEDIYCEPQYIQASAIREWVDGEGFSKYLWEISKDGKDFSETYHNVWRNKFDHWLLLKSGVDYLDGTRVTGFDELDDGVRVSIKGNGILQKVECKYLVGADGGGSTVRKILDPQWGNDETTLSVGVYQTYHNFKDLGSLCDGHWNVFFEKEISDALCCMHKKSDQVVLCVCGLKGQNLKSSMKLFKSFLQHKFQLELGEFVRDEGCVLRFADLNYGKNRVLLAGEAAGQIYLNGEGISAAIDGGFRAGSAIANSYDKLPNAVELFKQSCLDIERHIKNCQDQVRFFVK